MINDVPGIEFTNYRIKGKTMCKNKDELMVDAKPLNWLMKLISVFGIFMKVYSKVTVENLIGKFQESCVILTAEATALKEKLAISESFLAGKIKVAEGFEKALKISGEEILGLKSDIDRLNSVIVNSKNAISDRDAARIAKKVAEDNLEAVTKELNQLKSDIMAVADSETNVGDNKPVCKKKDRKAIRQANKKTTKTTPVKAKSGSVGDNKPKLDCDKLKIIRKRKEAGDKLTDIAKEYGVDPSTITNALAGKTYKKCQEAK